MRPMRLATFAACSMVSLYLAAQAGPSPPAASWTAAFDTLHARLVGEYPFTEHKGVDWTAMSATTRPRIRAAETAHDRDAYYLALREYVYAIPDGHVRFRADHAGDAELRRRHVGAGYGMGLTELQDGALVVTTLLPGGPAERAGIRLMDEVVAWNGQEAAAAVGAVSPLWARVPAATREGRRLQQVRFLTRAGAGVKAAVRVRTGERSPRELELVAETDGEAALARTEWRAWGSPGESRVQTRILPTGHGYLRITAFYGESAAANESIVAEAAAAVATFVRLQVPGVVLDLRQNQGGADGIAARVAGLFFTMPHFYLQAAYPDAETGTFEPKSDELIHVEPAPGAFAGPVVVLVSPETVSAGEGVAWAIRKRPHGKTLGFRGTNGSYGMTGGRVLMPEGLVVTFPVGRTLDEEGAILLDSGRSGEGGVRPDVQVPLTRELMRRSVVEGRDVELERAIAELP